MNRRERRAAQRRSQLADKQTDPTAIEAMLRTAIEQHQNGKLTAAEKNYRQVLRLQPQNADALHLLGLARHHQQDHREALSLIGRAIDIAPSVAQFHNSLSAALRGLGREDDAMASLQQAVALEPAYVDARVNLGELLAQSGKRADAIAAFDTALQYAPAEPGIHAALGELYLSAQNIQRAAHHLRKAAELDPGNAEAQFNLANVLFQQGDKDASVSALQKAISIDPGFAAAYERLGALLRDLGRSTDAVEVLKKSVAINASDAPSWFSLGLSYDDLGNLEKSKNALSRAIALNGNFVEAHQNLGTVLRAMGQYEEAIASYDRALALNPEYETAMTNRALARLAEGRFEEGWRQYLPRASVRKYGSRLHRTALPDDLSEQPVLVLFDQGLGDEIFFLRFVRELAERNASITYYGQSQIKTIVERLPFLNVVLDEASTAPPEEIGLWISAGDLPFLLEMKTEKDIPASIGLTPKPEFADAMKDRLARLGEPPYLGITWRAGVQKRNQLSKIAPADALATALRHTSGTIIALQRNPEPGEIDAFSDIMGRPVHDLTALNDDLEGMLALLDGLDDYICVSNTNVHLRDGVGKTSRVLVPHPADYRWMNSGDYSPWFPGTRVYRETYEAGWLSAFDALSADLIASYGSS